MDNQVRSEEQIPYKAKLCLIVSGKKIGLCASCMHKRHHIITAPKTHVQACMEVLKLWSVTASFKQTT